MASLAAAAAAVPMQFLDYNGKKDIHSSELSRRYEHLLLSEKFCDCVFILDAQKIKCHKLILAAASPVFEAMFFGPICENQHFVEILDMSADIFQILIKYIYRGYMDFKNLTLEETIELYYGAEKYLLNDLIAECLTNIRNKLRFSNILAALELSICLDLNNLLQICLTFFTQCCLNEAQFVEYLQKNYYHVAKECIKSIITLCKEQKATTKNLLWFIYEWCQQESMLCGLKDTASVIEDLNLEANEESECMELQQCNFKPQCQLIERSYYKACRPFTVDYDNFQHCTYVRTSKFISLQGITIQSRLTPHMSGRITIPPEYFENVAIEITVPNYDSSYVWSHMLNQCVTKYNCDLTIKWPNGIALSPDLEYQIKLIWHPSKANGAEYPCSLYSPKAEGIYFRDLDAYSGSLIKAIHFINLV